jgi:tetratricopeptide (TPR) repeat protein
MADKTAVARVAQEYARKGQIDKAISEWEKLLSESPDGNAFNTVGDLYLKKRSKKDAIEAFSRAAGIFREEGFALKAIALYKKILHISPLEVNALINLGELNAEKGLIGNANENLGAAAEVFMKEGETEKALEVFEKMLELSPSNVNLHLKVAQLYMDSGLKESAGKKYLAIAADYLEKDDRDTAKEYYLKAIECDSRNVPAYAGLSRISEDSGDLEQAYEYINKAVSLSADNSDVLSHYARIANVQGDIENARNAFIKLVELEPSNTFHRKNLGEVYMKEGSPEKAWNEFRPYVEDVMSNEQWDEAIGVLEQFRDVHPVEVRSMLVNVYKGKNERESAIRELKDLADICEEKNLDEDVLRLCQEVLELDPADSGAQEKIKVLEEKLGITGPSSGVTMEGKSAEEFLPEVDGYIQEGKYPEAAGLLEQLIDGFPDSTDLHERLKNVYIEQGNNDKAIGECLVLADLYKKEGNVERKNTIIAAAISLNPDDPRVSSMSLNDDIEVADSERDETVSAEENSDESVEEIIAEADFYSQQGLLEEAVSLYEKLLSTNPGNEEVRSKLAALKPSGVTEEAPPEKPGEPVEVDPELNDIFHEFKTGIDKELGDKDVESRYNLGIAYKEMGLLDDAIREFQISAKDPEKALQSSSMLALCYMEKKLYSNAINEFQKVLSLISPSEDGYLGAKCDLADAYVKNKEHKKALVLYTEIHSQNPQFRDVEQKVKIIRSMPPGKGDDEDSPKQKKDRVSYI